MPTNKDYNKPCRLCQIVTYYNSDIVKSGLTSALDGGIISSAEYIVHDKEESTPHIHINVAFPKVTRPSSLIKRFDDVAKEHQNSFVEPIKGTREDAHKYLTHDNVDKERYDEASIVTLGEKFLRKTNNNSKQADASDIIKDILDLTTEAEMVAKYGRDYVYHYDAWHNMAVRIGREQGVLFDAAYADTQKDIYRKYIYDTYQEIMNLQKYYSKEGISKNETLDQAKIS